MTLQLIEKAIRPQFVWAEHPRRRLQTSENRGKNTGFAMVIFIGIAESFNIPPKETAQYLDIGSPEYERKSMFYARHWEIAMQRKEQGTLCKGKQKDRTDCVYLKTKLTLNALNSLERM